MRAVVPVSICAAIALSLGSATPALAANQALMINGIGGGFALPDIVMSSVLGGMFAGYERHNIDWPQQARPVIGLRYSLGESIDIGVSNLDAAIRVALTQIGPGEHVTVVGLSAGSLVADEEIRRLGADPNIDPSKLNFVVVGDSSRMALNNNRHDLFLNYTYQAPVDSIYNTTTVAAMYDGFADFPNQMANLLAVANAIAGELVSHVSSMFTDLSTVAAGDVTVTTNPLGGVRTDYVITPAHLPLVQLIPVLGLFGESTLKSIIDSAYTRNELSGAHAKTSAAAPSAATAMPAAATVADVSPTYTPVAGADALADTSVPAGSGRDSEGVASIDVGEIPKAAVLSPSDVHPPSGEADSPAAGAHRGRHSGGDAGSDTKSIGAQDDSVSPPKARGHRAP